MNRCIVYLFFFIFFLRITQIPLYLYTSDFILSLCLCFLHRYQSALKLTSSSNSCVSDSNLIPSLLNSRYFLPSIFFSLFYYLNSSVVYLNIKWVFAPRVFVEMPKCFALFFLLLILEFDFDNIPPISFGQPLIEMNNRMKLPFNFNFCDFTFLLYKSPHGTKSH